MPIKIRSFQFELEFPTALINSVMIGKALLKGIWVLRWTAIIAALIYVGLNLVRTVRKALEGQVVVSLMKKTCMNISFLQSLFALSIKMEIRIFYQFYGFHRGTIQVNVFS